MNNKFPYKNKNIKYLYGVFEPEIVVLPLGIVWDLLEAWRYIKKAYDKKLSFSETIKYFGDHFELYSYCQGIIDDQRGNDEFALPFDASEVGFCNTNKLMDNYMPAEFLDKSFVKYSYTGYLEDIIIIKSEDEKIFLNYFKEKGEVIKRDDALMDEAVIPDWWYSQ